MHRYFIKTPWFVKKMFREFVWNFSRDDKSVYLTFDDGPHPHITPWVLEELKKYEAYATFFCIGKNVEQYTDIYESILSNGHATGNHTFNHLNGWKSKDDSYLEDILKASQLIHSNLFRPPYGRIKQSQTRSISSALGNACKIIMWDTLSGDFDKSFSAQRCINNVLENVQNGSIIVFHDSEKAYPNLKQALPAVLEFLSREGYKLNKIEQIAI